MSDYKREPLLEIDSLTVLRGDVAAVAGVSLSVEKGSFFVLVGPSGCGKTSLLRAIAGFERPTEGAINLGGRVLSDSGHWVVPEKRQIGMVFQDGALFPHLTVRDNIGYGVGRSPRAGERTDWALDLVGLGALADRYPDELSGGERQRVALARALAPEPLLLLLDEPFASLDPGLRQRVRDQVRAIVDRAGATAILVTHDQEEALSLADRVAVMAAGRILQVGLPERVYRSPASTEVAEFLGEGRLFDCVIRAGIARCVLGEIHVDASDGPARLLVRPEEIALVPAAGASVVGTVARLHFFGHDQIVVVELGQCEAGESEPAWGGPGRGELIEVRTVTPGVHEVGTRVGLSLSVVDATLFPARQNA